MRRVRRPALLGRSGRVSGNSGALRAGTSRSRRPRAVRGRSLQVRAVIHRTHAHPCPVCAMTLDGAINADGSRSAPRAGDCTVCSSCGAVLRFHVTTSRPKRGGLVQVSKEEFARLPDATRAALVDAVQTVNGRARN